VANDRERWWLENAEERNAEAPDSYFIPPREKRESLQVGDLVKLLFAYEPVKPGAPTVERMWVEVVSAVPPSYVGTLANQPTHIRSLVVGDRVEFGPQHVAAYYWTPEELGYNPGHVAWTRRESSVPHGVRPQQVAMRPTEERGPEGDSGWMLGAGDESREQVTDEAVFGWTDLGSLTDLYPKLEPVFRAGVGSWRWREAQSAYERVDV
jgi:hypothetical protein